MRKFGMKTEWNYSTLAESYVKRPQYSKLAIDALINNCKLNRDDQVADIGAGVGHLTKHLATHNFLVSAVEPNDQMREIGESLLKEFSNVSWFEGTGEVSNLSENSFGLVTFGSSFNVCDRQEALKESYRILQTNGWFACMWNHRDLLDPIQNRIEDVIIKNIPNYDYGTRREDQTLVINDSKLFSDVLFISSKVVHKQNYSDLIEAWKSHATLQRQAGEVFEEIINEIDFTLAKEFGLSLESVVDVPYETKIWAAKK